MPGVFPRLRTEARYRPRSQPRRRRGASAACSSRNGVTVTVASGTVTSSGCSAGSTRMPRGNSPARELGERGGARRTVTVSDVPG